MGFHIEITEVGPNEYPLLQVLREAVFSEFGHTSRTPISDSLAQRQDLFVLIAHLEGNPVGFSAGYRRKPGVYYINYLALLREYRRQGLGKQMINRLEDYARSLGYSQIEFNTFNHFPGMLRLGLAMGYRPVGLQQDSMTDHDLAIRFAKSLKPESVDNPRPQDEIGIDAADRTALRNALDRGLLIAGLVRDQDARLRVVVQSPKQ